MLNLVNVLLNELQVSVQGLVIDESITPFLSFNEKLRELVKTLQEFNKNRNTFEKYIKLLTECAKFYYVMKDEYRKKSLILLLAVVKEVYLFSGKKVYYDFNR